MPGSSISTHYTVCPYNCWPVNCGIMVEVRDGRLTIHVAEGAPAAPLVSLLVHAGVQVEEVHRSAASLEDVFLSLMEGQP